MPRRLGLCVGEGIIQPDCLLTWSVKADKQCQTFWYWDENGRWILIADNQSRLGEVDGINDLTGDVKAVII